MKSVALLSVLIFFASTCFAQQGRPRIAVGGVTAESNSLYGKPTPMVAGGRDSARTREEWFAEAEKANTIASGIVSVAGKLGLDVYPVHRARASSLGYVDDASFNEQVNRLVRDIRDAKPKFDGVILTLHGAMVVASYLHGDAEVVRRVREAMGKDFPIVVTHDFHANVSPEIVRDSNVLITYKENPHVDTKERGAQAATILARMLRREVKPVQALVKPPMLLNIVFHDTFNGPLRPFKEESRRLEKQNPKILAVSVPGGYQWADVPQVGPSVVVVTDNDPVLAEREAQRLADGIYALREKLVLNVPDPATAVRMAMKAEKFPVALMDTGDNIGGGSAGDGTFILAELLKQKAQGWVMTIADKDANEAAFRAGVGQPFDQLVGGKTDKIHGDPVRVRGRVKSLHDGNYVETEIRHGGGRYGQMGLTAVIEVEGSTRDLPNLLLLTTRPTSPNSLHQIISNGVYPERQRILVAKGTTAPRAAYEPIAARIIEVNSRGATDVNPAHFTYKNARRPLYGLP